MPLAQTPMSEQDGRKMQRYARQVQRDIEAIAPWLVEKRPSRRMRRSDVQPGEVAVILDDGETMDSKVFQELFGDTPVVKK